LVLYYANILLKNQNPFVFKNINFMELFNALGLNVKTLLAQLINFAVLFFVLYRFGYRPMLKFLDERKEKIEKGITDAEKAQEKLIQMTEDEKNIIKEARKEALVMIEKAKNDAGEKRNDILKKAKEEIGKVIDIEKAKMQIEKAETLKEIKREAAELIIVAMEKVLEARLGDKNDKELIKKIVKDLQ